MDIRSWYQSSVFDFGDGLAGTMRKTSIGRQLSAAFLYAAAIAFAGAASAQTLEDLDRLAQASVKPKEGLVLAQSQAGAGDWLEALATLERVLAIDPKNKQARLMHASLLCSVDDPEGAKVEFARLKSGAYKKAEWTAAIAPCANLGGSAR